MGKINVYLPAELEREVRSADLNVSSICQSALREALHHPKPSDQCGHHVIVRGRCEICGDHVEFKAAPKRRRAS